MNQTELNSYPVNDLVQAEGDFKVYQLTEGKKKWIASAEAFDSYGFDWSKIAPINQTELDAYPTGETIN